MQGRKSLGLICAITASLISLSVQAAPEQSEVVARMDCTVNARGKVLRLVKLNDNAPDAKMRSL